MTYTNTIIWLPLILIAVF